MSTSTAHHLQGKVRNTFPRKRREERGYLDSGQVGRFARAYPCRPCAVRASGSERSILFEMICARTADLTAAHRDRTLPVQDGLLAELPEEEDVSRCCENLPHDQPRTTTRTTLARSETEIAVAANMSATGAKRHPKVLSSSGTAAQAALWAVCDRAPRLGITNLPKGDDFLTVTPPKWHPGVNS
jgi:hypothetical protein